MEYHEVANIFPLMQGEEYQALAADIASNGLLEPIWLHPDGRIIDGRNRYRACVDLGIKPDFRTWNGNGSLISFVVSLNLHRRHLSSSQRAALAVEVLPMLEGEARSRMAVGGKGVEKIPPLERNKSRDAAATLFGTNGRYVSDAKRIKSESPEMFEKISSGAMTISKARASMRPHYSSDSDEWETPPELFDRLDREFGFALDVCALPHNAKCDNYFSPEDDALSRAWRGVCWMNPPYGREIGAWMKKAAASAAKGACVVCLVPARVDTSWWWNYARWGEVRFLRGRIKFLNTDGRNDAAPFPSAVVILSPSHEQKTVYWND